MSKNTVDMHAILRMLRARVTQLRAPRHAESLVQYPARVLSQHRVASNDANWAMTPDRDAGATAKRTCNPDGQRLPHDPSASGSPLRGGAAILAFPQRRRNG